MIDAINSVNIRASPRSRPSRGGSRRRHFLRFQRSHLWRPGVVERRTLPCPRSRTWPATPLEANREDLSTQFTILMPTVGLDFGDAPDPVNQIDGRYPTTNANNGPRHVVDDELFLGSSIDADLDGVPGVPPMATT